MRILFWLLGLAGLLGAQQYDLVLQGGHVIDPKSGVNKVLDVAIAGGKIARIAANIPAAEAKRTADVRGLYVTPGLIDIHVHVYAGTGAKATAGDKSVYPDGFSFRAGVTTMVDAGSSGWRTFPDFRQRVIDRAQTRVLALLNIVGSGMNGSSENDPNDMDVAKAVAMAKANRNIVVGFKTAHYSGPGWISVDRAVAAGKAAGLPVMVDFGNIGHERNISTLFLKKLRPGDIYTHCFSGHRKELLDNGKLNPAMWAGRKRGIVFDLGHGAGSFYWYVAVPAFEEKFFPDSISTDLHTASMNAGMIDMPNVMSKILNLGASLEQVIAMTTWKPAQEIGRPELGHLSEGATADVAVLRLEQGRFGFVDSAGARKFGTKRLGVEMTIHNGEVMWDLNGRASQDWEHFPYKKGQPLH